ncbi:hypothetical protein [Sphingomonas sp. ID0503]|uniref:hypothetical protein n=1 Tax=Sphingomonas sp. ID0503 TaxID=3399691 RepID=UPI003AFAECE0
MAAPADADSGSSDKALIILQSLLCLLRDKNVLSRADIEELRDLVQSRAASRSKDLPCCTESANAAAVEMRDLGDYIGRRYGGKHRRTQ